MKTYIRKDASTPTGYALKVVDDNDNESILPITDVVKNDPKVLVLPTNPSNRKYFTKTKVGDGDLELSYKASITLGPRIGEPSQRKSLVEYLTEEEKAIYDDLMAKAKARRDRPMTDLEKAELAYKKALEKYEALKAQSDEAHKKYKELKEKGDWTA